MKTHTDLEQSKKLTEILPIESADHFHIIGHLHTDGPRYEVIRPKNEVSDHDSYWPCWSLAALLSLIKDKCGYFEFVYLKRTYDGRANPLEDVYRLSTDEYDVYNKEMVDACYELIIKLKEMDLL